MLNNKKSQTEIIGLVFVVMILAFGIIFVGYKISTDEPDESAQEFDDVQLSQNFLLALNNINVKECNDMKMNNLLSYCLPDNKTQICGLNKASCTIAQEIIQDILNQSLLKWNKRFYLIFETSGKNISFQNNCNINDLNTEYYKPGQVYITGGRRGTLYICKD